MKKVTAISKINCFLQISVFTSGFCVMTFELLGVRMFAPFLGMSMYVWTSIIGVVMGSLSLGYFLGGKIADKRPDYNILSLAFVTAGFITATVAVFQEPLLFLLSRMDKITGSVSGAIIIFGPINIMLGMVIPMAVKLYCSDNNIGNSAGTIYAISTVGSLFGTFVTGFFLIPRFGIVELLVVIATVLFFNAYIMQWGKNRKKRSLALISIAIIIFFIFLFSFFLVRKKMRLVYGYDIAADINTLYRRVRIQDINKNIRVLSDWQSAIYLDPKLKDLLVQNHLKYFRLVEHFNPGFKKALMIGGGGYAFPRFFQIRYPDRYLDVVEIDPKMIEIANKYFDFQPGERFRNFTEDGRIFLNKNREKYDIIFEDAYSRNDSVPFQLATREAMLRVYDSLNEGGIFIMNIISHLTGDKGRYFRAQYHTIRKVFPKVYVFPVHDVDNIILIATKGDNEIRMHNADLELQRYIDRLYLPEIPCDVPILTDNYAPVEYLSLNNLIY